MAQPDDSTLEAEMARTRHALRETAGLLKAAQAIMGSTTLEEVCRNLTIQFNDLVQADKLIVYLVDHERRQIAYSMYDGNPIGDEDEITYDLLERGISGLVFQSGQPVLSQSADDGIEPAATRKRRKWGGTGSLIVVPLVARGRVIGTVTASNRVDQRRFTQHDVDLLMALATQAATTIDNVRLLAETERQLQRWESISAVNEITSAQLDEDRLFDLLYRQALRLTGVPEEDAFFFVARYDPAREAFSFDFVIEWGSRQPAETMSLGLGFSSWVVRHRRALLTHDVMAQQEELGYQVHLSERERATGQWPRSCIAVPLRIGSQVTGVMSVQSLNPGVFTVEHLELLKMWSGQIAIALENAHLYDEIRRLNEQLEQMVQQRTAELERAYRRLELLNRSKSRFVNVAAHELRSPLMVIQGYAQELQDCALPGDDRDAAMFLDSILEGVDRLRAISDSLIDLMLIDTQALDVQKEPVVLADVIARAGAEFSDALQARKLTLTIADLESLPAVQGSAGLLSKLFTQLIVNAIKYTPDGGTIAVSGRETIGGDGPASVTITVSDTGIGIDPEHQDLIFERFHLVASDRFHSSGKTKFKGGGAALGLAIARGIASAHGGEIWVESEGYDEERCPGSQFHVRLPVSDRVTQAPGPE